MIAAIVYQAMPVQITLQLIAHLVNVSKDTIAPERLPLTCQSNHHKEEGYARRNISALSVHKNKFLVRLENIALLKDLPPLQAIVSRDFFVQGDLKLVFLEVQEAIFVQLVDIVRREALLLYNALIRTINT